MPQNLFSSCRSSNWPPVRSNNYSLKDYPGKLRRVSLPLASRALLQMDKAKPAHQEFLWHFGERRKNSNTETTMQLEMSNSENQLNLFT